MLSFMPSPLSWIISLCFAYLDGIVGNGGECQAVGDAFESDIAKIVVGTTQLKAVELGVGTNSWINVGMPISGNQDGVSTKVFDEKVVLLGSGTKDILARATGSTLRGEEGYKQVVDSVSIEAVDDTPPLLHCNSPTTIHPPLVGSPICFTATATDNCAADLKLDVVSLDCWAINNGSGEGIDKPCDTFVIDDDVCIVDGEDGDVIEWTIEARVPNNVVMNKCAVMVVSRGDDGPQDDGPTRWREEMKRKQSLAKRGL